MIVRINTEMGIRKKIVTYAEIAQLVAGWNSQSKRCLFDIVHTN